MGNIVLSNGVRQNLLALQDTSRAAEKTQVRLATGKKVNTAIDDPVNFFTSATLQNRANLLSGLMDGISNGIQTINSASSGIDAITKLVQSAQATIRQALNDSAQNRPNRIGNANPGVVPGYTTQAGLGPEGPTINQSKQDVALSKKIEEATAGAGAVAATATGAGNLGIAANSYVTLKAGATTYQFQTTSSMTMRDLVSEINKSGIATASVDTNGQFAVTGTGSDALTFTVGSVAYTNGSAAGEKDGTDNLGFSATDVNALATGVSATANSAIRTSLIEQFNTLRTQIGKLSQDAGYNGTNLLGGNMLKIVFNEKTGSARNTLDIQGFSITAESLGIQPAANAAQTGYTNFQNDIDLNNADQALTDSLSTLRGMASTLGANLAVVQSRQDFTKQMMTTLKTGADNLVLADSNEEGANLLALQTRQQLSQTALSLAAQADQSVLKLFG